jgi:hypothetical protein
MAVSDLFHTIQVYVTLPLFCYMTMRTSTVETG